MVFVMRISFFRVCLVCKWVEIFDEYEDFNPVLNTKRLSRTSGNSMELFEIIQVFTNKPITANITY